MGKYYYIVYGLTLESDYEFPQFVSIDKPEKAVDIAIEYGGISDEVMEQVKNGYYSGHRYHDKWFRNKAGLFWIHDDRKINFTEYDEGNVDDAAQYLPGMCLSILLWYRGMIMIHGACLRYKDKTVIIAGNSGSGKSTISTEFIKKGAKLIADDVTGIGIEAGKYYSYPAFPAQKLCMDQIEKNGIDTRGLRQIRYDLNKFEIPRNQIFYNEKSSVDYLFRIESREKVLNDFGLDFQAVDGAEKIKELTDVIFIRWMFHDAFRFEPEDLARCIGFVNNLPMHKIVRERGKDTIRGIIDYIESNITK